MPIPLRVQSLIENSRSRWVEWSRCLDAHTFTSRQLVWIFLCSAILLISRKPTAFLQAQFYAEDGRVWYAQAYNLGWLHSMAKPDAGYLNTLPRLGAVLAVLVPFRWAPLMTVVCGLLVQCLPVLILLSARARTWGSLSTRFLFALIYILSPNAREIHVVLTNTQWHLSLAALLLACSEPPLTMLAAVGDVVCFVVAGLSGPFSILLTPPLLLNWWLRRERWTAILAAITLVCALIETRVILLSHSIRYLGPLGANARRFFCMVGGDIVSGSLLGANLTHAFHLLWDRFVPQGSPLVYLSLLWLVPISIAGIVIYAHVLRKAPLPLKLLTFYAFLMLAASLRSPLITGSDPLWELLIETTNGRYWFTPMMALLWGAVWCARFANVGLAQRTATAMLCCLPVGILLDYNYRPGPNFHFPTEYNIVRDAQPGTTVTFPIPPGAGWDMTLIKRGPAGTIETH